MPKKKSVKKPDWRTLPRKPAAQKQSERITIRVTLGELAAIREKAAAAGLTMRDYIVGRSLR